MQTTELLKFMDSSEDPLDPTVEKTFKHNPPDLGEDPEVAFQYWIKHMDIYGTPTSHISVRAMFYNYKALYYNWRSKIHMLELALKECKDRNVRLLSEIQEYEAREQ